jgi:phosphoribosylamine--glycine ligase
MNELLYGIASGELSKLRARGGFQLGVRIVVPPFPFTDPERFESTSKDSVILFKTPSREGIHIEDVKEVNGEWLVTGTSGVALIVCGVGPTMRQAQRQAYNRVRNVMIPNMYYREDIGDRWSEEDSDRLHAWRYLRES